MTTINSGGDFSKVQLIPGRGPQARQAAESDALLKATDGLVLSGPGLNEATDLSRIVGASGAEAWTTGTQMAAALSGPTAVGVTLKCTPQQLGTAAFQQTLATLASSGIAVSITLVNCADTQPQLPGGDCVLPQEFHIAGNTAVLQELRGLRDVVDQVKTTVTEVRRAQQEVEVVPSVVKSTSLGWTHEIPWYESE